MEHTKHYEDCRHDMQTILTMEEKYGIAEERFRTALATLDQFHVVTPIVGKFSTGKSSLLNALLGKNYLRTQITPETAIPTELRWGSSERVILHRKNGAQDEISLEAFMDTDYRVEDMYSIELILNNPALKTISTVKIVDMPASTPALRCTTAPLTIISPRATLTSSPLMPPSHSLLRALYASCRS